MLEWLLRIVLSPTEPTHPIIMIKVWASGSIGIGMCVQYQNYVGCGRARFGMYGNRS